MKRTLTAAAVFVATAIPASAMQQELNSLTGVLFSELSRMQMEVGNMSNLTLGQINQIAAITNSGDSEAEKRAAIDTILRRAAGN